MSGGKKFLTSLFVERLHCCQPAFQKFYRWYATLGTGTTILQAVICKGRCWDLGNFSSTRLAGTCCYLVQISLKPSLIWFQNSNKMNRSWGHLSGCKKGLRRFCLTSPQDVGSVTPVSVLKVEVTCVNTWVCATIFHYLAVAATKLDYFETCGFLVLRHNADYVLQTCFRLLRHLVRFSVFDAFFWFVT